MADGALTLTMTFPRSSASLKLPTLKVEGIALPLGTIVDGAVGIVAAVDGAEGVAEGFGATGMLGLLGALGIFGRLALLETLGVENDGLEI